MLNDKDVANRLISLCQLDIDAVRAYEQAIQACDHFEVSSKLREFQGDHERHIRDLSQAIRKYGETPPEHKPDVKGFLLEGMTAIRSITGTAGALKAMDTNEQLTNNRYKAALELDLPTETRELVQVNYNDERRHLAWIRQAIDRKVWEERPGASPSL